jgi:hypothetical protein
MLLKNAVVLHPLAGVSREIRSIYFLFLSLTPRANMRTHDP